MEKEMQDAQKTVGAKDHVIVTNESSCSDETAQKIKEKIFKLQSRFTQDLKEIQQENDGLKIEGKIIFDLSEIKELCGGVAISVFLKGR